MANSPPRGEGESAETASEKLHQYHVDRANDAERRGDDATEVREDDKAADQTALQKKMTGGVKPPKNGQTKKGKKHHIRDYRVEYVDRCYQGRNTGICGTLSRGKL
jgi:hypothetical protein